MRLRLTLPEALLIAFMLIVLGISLAINASIWRYRLRQWWLDRTHPAVEVHT
jgi:hypothetical protein